ncbi:MAG: DUF5716 family protein [Candidatus Pelethousia sp.]|nr:DUF5716 family protein [Candidatus Pelethousia sp.]
MEQNRGMRLFDVLPTDFFKPLSGCNKNEYAAVITLIWDQCKRSPTYSMEKAVLLDEIEDYFTGLGPLENFDEEEQEGILPKSDSRFLATAFTRRLKNTGWLEDVAIGYEEEQRMAVNHRVIPIIRAFSDILNPKRITYKGKLFKIYALLQTVNEQESPYESVLREVSTDMDELNNSLRQLNASIGQYLDEMTRNKTPQEVLELFNQYEDKVVVGAYHRFKTSDNLFYYRTALQERLDDCETEYFQKLVDDYCKVEYSSLADATLAVRELIRKIRDDVQEMSIIMREIDDRHVMYRSRAVQRAQFLLLSDGSIKGKINQLLKYYALVLQNGGDITDIDDSIISSSFVLTPQKAYGERFLATPTSARAPTPITPMENIFPLSEEEIRLEQEKLLAYARGAVTTENVNRFADRALQNQNAVLASTLAKDAPDEFAKIIGLHAYSLSPERTYELELKDDWVSRSGMRFQDFVVKRRS